MTGEQKTLAIIAIAILSAVVITSFAPDTIAQRIDACMQQPNMKYEFNKCIPVKE